ncbi:dipeptidase PepV [Falsibacillus albus]|uniref:Dipeptidase PepV n=1 Tax=Falsibacillus albus TaxID=2478915 RepID=A0A3L7K4A7_9BACI|nr:dipeptidase PepV [Falsibacillus albus]RLQ97883.1 dipeptidase PepV [Falsibacillus albus]
MTTINWMEEVEKRKEDLLQDLQKFLQIKSVLDEEDTSENAPFGEGVKEALDYLLNLGEKDGFTGKNVDGYGGHLEMGAGEELLGILCHVDVVPEGDGWSFDPFGGEISDGKIYARGAIDDKGPTMAAYYAMKIVKELGLPLNKRIRMIIGADEESDWRCVDHYFKKEEMPSMGFAPDADFPIIYAEKGIADYDLVCKPSYEQTDEKIFVRSFHSGRRYNMVPDFAKAILVVQGDHTEVLQEFDQYIAKWELEGNYYVDNGELYLEVKGQSVHGMEPDLGKNAGIFLAGFLSEFELDKNSNTFIQFIKKNFFQDSRGRALEVLYRDDITGDLTINVGKLHYEANEGGRLGLNMRYPVTFDLDKEKEALWSRVHNEGFDVENFTDSKPHHVDEKDPLIQTLKKVYEEQTGEKGELISIGGGTYARSLKSGVAFGPLFPGRPDVAHQKDEYMILEDLFKATAIYAQAIYELANK